MVWTVENSHEQEAAKIRWEVVPYTRGRVLDIGAGSCKCFPHFISVDNGHHEIFGQYIQPDIRCEADKLDLIASHSCDAVFSSHLLEHFEYENVPAVLSEWARVVKKGGYLILYVPDEAEYPAVGDDHANPDHKWNVNFEKVILAMGGIRSWDLVDYQVRHADDEYSLFFVFKLHQHEGPDKQSFSYRKPKPEKTAAVVRYGAFGDLAQASSVFAGLKKAGFHVTVYSSPPGSDVITHDPNIDRIIMQDKDQVPNGALGEFWSAIAKKYDRFVNLSESVEGTFLAIAGRANHAWPHEVRHGLMNRNYLEFQHQLAGVPHEPNVRFYATLEEKQWARMQRERMSGPVIVWSLAGSSVHKTWAGLDQILARILITYPTANVVLVGGPDCVILEAGWENEKRVHKTSGKWSIRQSLAFLDQADLVIGSETGVLNAASCLPVPKVVFLSHSSVENLTRDWVNTVSLVPQNTKCYPCHQLHTGWKHCWKHEESGTAMCQQNISAETVWEAVTGILGKPIERAA